MIEVVRRHAPLLIIGYLIASAAMATAVSTIVNIVR